MAVSCQPADLAEVAKDYRGFSEIQKLSIMIWLLQQVAGNTMTASELLEESRCLCMSEEKQMQVMNYLLCQIVNLLEAP